MTTIAESIDLIRRRINECARESGRAADSVQLLGVSKRQPVDKLREAHAAGLQHFAENYLQEALDKQAALADLACTWHFIGAIQSNKTRALAEHFDWVHSVASRKIARRLSEQRPAGLAPLNVCIQIKLSDEESKSGIELGEAEALCGTIAELAGLRLRGLMAIPAPVSGHDAQRRSFRPLAREFERLRERFPQMDTLSMGMSGDFEAAIAEGSTLLRLGTALFGPRD